MNSLFDALIRGSIKNRHLVLLAAAVPVALGAYWIRGVHRDALPNFTPPMVVVQAEAPGLGSSAVEERVTSPLEQSLLGIPHATQVRSSSSPGLSVLNITFAEDADIFRARQLVGERLARAAERLPAGLPPPRLAPITATVGALLRFVYTASDDALGMQELWRFTTWQVLPRLEAIEGVSRVTVHGGAAARVEIRPDPAKLLARGVGLSELARSLGSAQSSSALGHALAGPQQQPVRANGRWAFGDLKPIENTVVASGNGLPIRVSDVAQVALGQAPAVGAVLYDDKDGIYLQIDKLPWADTVRVTERVEQALRELDASLPPGAKRNPSVFRQADFIHTSLFAVGRAMALGAVFVIVILALFLRSARLCTISLTALPLSIIAAVAVLLLRGVTINGMILGGLAIAVGEVVDDAVVDVENIWRRIRASTESASARPVLETIRDASTEVRSAVVYASGIVIVVLLPIMLLGGVAGRIFSPLAETYALAVAASLLVALTVTPALSAVLLPRLAGSPRPEPGITRRLRSLYDRLLERIQRRPGSIAVVAAGLGATALGILPFVGGGFLPEFREGVLIADASAWPGTSLEETTRMAKQISAKLRKEGGIRHVAVRVGRASLDEDAAPVHRMEIDLVLPSDADDPEEVAERATALMNDIPGIRFTVEGFFGERINELLSGERAPIALTLHGSDLVSLRDEAKRLMASMQTVEHISAVRSVGLVDVPTLDLEFDERRLSAAGLLRSEVVDAVAAWRHGLQVAEIKTSGGLPLPVVIAGDERFRERDRLAALPVITATKTAVPVSSVAAVVERSEPPAIDHQGGRRTIAVTAHASAAHFSEATAHVESLAKKVLNPDTEWVMAGQASERREASLRLAVKVTLVLAAVFAFLWMAFGSVLDAAVVLGGLPLGLIGGVVAAMVLPEGLSMAGLVGFVALAGITSRNGIMLVAHKNRLLSEGRRGGEALVVQAAQERLLPIVMTGATAFFGLLPLAASIGEPGSELEAPMAFIVCGGLLSSTALNLVAVPAFFLWHERRRARKGNSP